ncbi:FAD-dependent oxidoreductase [Paenalkalicoccus suaedae]|uniref:FAD-dependent oxidoreductase n=1 Tax=Paenalkalicoccus suaedae TaxID=2592382 RepID=A0A859FEP5_9BACI|nr:FAD-dependent oxidoreductase [Paenalkalicoccus suaedae]QKS71172.1 FAD-dependent oxidoreductase [Paenalkalicoccus suaedae]
MKNIVIVGSGFGGVTAGALLQKEGYNVTLLEAAAEWGGSASKYRRNHYRFPVGATLGMGFEHNGIHERINSFLGIDVQKRLLSSVMQVDVGKQFISYEQNRDRFIKEWERVEPNYSNQIRAFFKEAWSIAAGLHAHMAHFPVIPPATVWEISALLKGVNLRTFGLPRYLFTTVGDLVEKHDLKECRSFVTFIDGVLLDSMQTSYENIPAYIGATALDVYHRGAYYIDGGLYELIDELIESIRSNGGVVKKPRHIKRIVKHANGYTLYDQRDRSYEADHVVLNMPLLNMKDLLEPHVYETMALKWNRREQVDQWGTFTMYVAIKEAAVTDTTPLFSQLQLEDGHHFFVSLSRKDDVRRAPKGFRTFTISTHITLSEWQTKADYDYHKTRLTREIIKKLSQTIMPNIESYIEWQESGGPIAWERYTNRKGGGVGGFPQTKENALWNAVSHRTGIPGLWICGDNVYPGAGSIGASSSGVHVARSISKKRLL